MSKIEQIQTSEKIKDNSTLNFDSDTPFSSVYLSNLSQYRIKNHCHYEPTTVNSQDYSIFQIEIVDVDLQRYHQGRFILEVWTRNGEKIFSRVLNNECTQWKVYNNVFVFKESSFAPNIYIIWLNEKKMVSYKHPYEDNKEIDLIYYDGCLIVASSKSFRCIPIVPSEVNTIIQNFSGEKDDQVAPMIQKETLGMNSQDTIVGLVPNPNQHELVFICQNEQKSVVFYRYQQTVINQKRQFLLQKFDDSAASKKQKIDKRLQQLIIQSPQILQSLVLSKNGNTYLVLLRQNYLIEVIENFQSTIYAEQVQKLSKLLPWFGDILTFQFEDNTITQALSLEKIQERQPISDGEFYRQQTLPPKNSTIGDIHKNVFFFSDCVVVNQSVFLLRDNIVFLIDSQQEKVLAKYFTKGKILGLFKLKQSSEDESGYKTTAFKVIALNKNGSLQVFIPNDIHLQQDWQRQEITQTPMLQAKDLLLQGFQNQNSLSNLYITSLTQQGDQKLYQMMFNSQIIEVNVRLAKVDMCFSVNYTTRNREMIGVIDHKNLTIYKNEKGNMTKMFQVNIVANEIKDFITGTNSIFFFHREYLLVLCNERVFRISTKTSSVDMLRLRDPVQAHMGGCFLDTQYFYFVEKNEEEQAYKVCVLGIDMIDAAFNEASRDQQNAINIEKHKGSHQVQLLYPEWSVPKTVKKIDYDEFNASFNLLLANLELIQFPLLHRNTFQFQSMAERTFYLAFRKTKLYFFALDKQNYMNCWNRRSGALLSRTLVQDKDYRTYEVDRGLYDKDWFSYSLIYSRSKDTVGSEDNILNTQVRYMTFKAIQITDKGTVHEILQFEHPSKNQNEMHLYFNQDFTKMLEILINKQKKFAKATYNVYSHGDSGKWHFDLTINQQDSSYLEWHQKTFYPYNLNLKDLQPHEKQIVKPTSQDLFKVLGNGKAKVLNLKDGIEMIINLQTGQIENYLALMYSFQTTQESFYDKRSGQQYVQDITERLQNYYENIRRKIFLQNKWVPKIRSIDVSARNFKQKYLIEQSFTYLDYRFFRQFIEVEQSQQFKRQVNENNQQSHIIKLVKVMSEDHLKRLVHNFFPGKNTTIMHYIAQSSQGFECVDYLMQLSKRAGFVVPFLIDGEGLTPLDITVTKKDHKQTNSLMRMLSKAPMDHHSRLISHLMPKLIDMGVPALEKYFDKRKYQTGICKTLNIAKIAIQEDKEFKAIASTLANENEADILDSLTNTQFKEQSVQLEVLDLPLSLSKPTDLRKLEQHNLGEKNSNEYEINMIKALANCENLNLFNQKSIRAFIDYLWPKTRQIIATKLFLPYMSFILYYMIFLMVIKKLTITEIADPAFYSFTSDIFYMFNFLFKLILFLYCFYFFSHDFQQIKNVMGNKIVLWSYANILPLILMIFIIVFDTFINNFSTQVEKMFYSASAFFIWIRVLHLLKCYTQTSYLLRMGTQILFRMRYLISFIIISLFAFGFTFYFLGADDATPYSGIAQMFLVLIGNYDASEFDSTYLSILFVLTTCFNFFFIFTLLIALSVVAFTNESDVYSNEAYQDKAQMMALYSYLLKDKTIRDPSKKYLLIATVTENKLSKRKDKQGGGFGSQGNVGDSKQIQMKMMKSFDRKFATMNLKMEKQMKDVSDRLDLLMETQQKIVSYSRPSPQKK